MKVTGRMGNWPIETSWHVQAHAGTNVTTQLERPVLAAERAYEVCAIEFRSSEHGHFWLIGEAFAERAEAGCVYPDLVPFEKCEIVDGSLPTTWTTRMIHAPTSTIVFMGPAAFIAPGFHEKLTNGDATAVKQFLDFLRSDQPNLELVEPS